jgi:hypothetical protein
MTPSTPTASKNAIRIGGASGFWGDSMVGRAPTGAPGPARLPGVGERHAVPVAATADDTATPPIAAPAPFADEGEPTQPVRLVRLAWARSGDKGDLSKIGLVARRPEWLPLLWARVTPEAVQAWFAHLVRGRVERFHLPGIAAMSLLLYEALDGGGPSSMRMDPLGKGMAQILLDMEIEVPRSIAQAL